MAAERAKYGEHAERLLSVKPGLGGMWQVYGRSDTTYEQRVAMDMAYVDGRSLAARPEAAGADRRRRPPRPRRLLSGRRTFY